MAGWAAELSERVELLGAFDPFGDDGDFEGLPQLDCCAHDGAAAGLVERGDEGSVELEYVEREALEAAER